MQKPKTIVIASQNVNKVREFVQAFQAVGIIVQSSKDFANVPKVTETGSTFTENATLKATQTAKFLHQPVIADDSGLVVPALDGRPGIYSARYAGDHDDVANNQKLLNELINVKKRDAYFESVLVYCTPVGEMVCASGRINGSILTELHGDNGFGYDPLFYVPSKKKSLAELSISEKNRISHRGNAIKNLIRELSKKWDQ